MKDTDMNITGLQATALADVLAHVDNAYDVYMQMLSSGNLVVNTQSATIWIYADGERHHHPKRRGPG